MGYIILFIFIGIPILLVPTGILLDKILKNYTFEKKSLNIVLIITALFGNPFSILISYLLVSFLIGDTKNLWLQYLLFIILIPFFMYIVYVFWKDKQKSNNSILFFSKRYSVQFIYLSYYIFHFIFNGFNAYDVEKGLIFYYFELPSMIISGLIVALYVNYKNKKRKD